MRRLVLLLIPLLLAASLAWGKDPFARVDSAELQRLMKQGKPAPVVIDTRSAVEYAEAHITGAVSIPYAAMERDNASPPYPRDTPLVFYCTGYS